MRKLLAKLLVFTILFNFISPIFNIGQVFADSLTVDFETTNGYTVTEGTWNLTTADKQEGSYSIVADNGGNDNTSSCFEITRDSQNDSNISFYYKVSSESNYDFLHFYIDGTEQDKWSGDVAWTEYTKSIDSGNHTFKWCYTKDGSVSNGSDTAWVDIFYSEDVLIEEGTILDFETSGGYTVTEGTWDRTTGDKYEGSYSIVADNGGANNSTSCFTRDENFSETGSISFYYKVSSETNYDYLRFYIDGTEVDKWAGDINWTNYSKEVSSGDHTFKWCYTKDGSQNDGSDTAWVDYVTKQFTKEAIFLDEITPIGLTSDNTPDYTFNTPITGDITYSGSCDSSTNSTSSTGNVTITFNNLTDGTYNDCKVKVSNDTDSSEWLTISEFTIDSIAPIITENIPTNEEVKAGDFQINISHSDTGGIDLTGTTINIEKWLGGNSWTGVTNDVLTNINTTDTGTTADFSGNDGKYRILYTAKDLAGNTSNKTIIFYIDTDTIVDFENTSGYTADSADWDRQTTKVYEGTYALESQNRSDDTTACFTINETIPGTGSVDFYYSISSESGYDFLHFYIDGTEQDKWAGDVDWTKSTTYTFDANNDHELKWCYTKDGSVSNGDDRAWVDYIVMQRADKPTITEVTPVATPTTDNTPDYTFNTSIDGNIAYSGSCNVSGNPTSATAGDNTITFGTLTDGNYTDCQIQVTSSTDSTPWLDVTDFTVDANGPIYSSTFPISNQIIPKNDFDITLSYSDSPSGVDDTSYTFNLYKWDSGSSSWNDITSNLTNSGVTTSNASFTTSNLTYGKYRYDFSIKDNSGNQSNKSIEFYIDEPELIISTGSINIGKLNDTTNTFGDTLTVTVKTIGAPFNVKLQKNQQLTHSNGNDFIPYYDGNIGMGYDKNNDGNLNDFNDDIILNDAGTLNTDGNLNIYTYTLKMGAIIEKLQVGGDYTGKINFNIELNY